MPKRPPKDTRLRWGEGRIKTRPRRDRDPVYQALWSERQPDGTTRERAQTFASRDAAEDHLRDVQRAKRDGRYTTPDSLTVAGLMTDWLARGAGNWEPSTRVAYRERFEGHIKPGLGSLRLASLTTPRIQRWVDELRGAGLASSTIDGVVRCLRSALRQAVRLGLIPYNPAADVTTPAVRHKAPLTWTEAEVAAFLAQVAADPMLHALYLVALATGVRPGELLALRWRDVDVEERLIQVRATMTRDEQNRPILTEHTKTKRSRAVALPAACVMTLHRWADEQKRQRAAAKVWHELGFLFTLEDGRRLPKTTWQKIHVALEEKAGVRHLTFHGLRHTNATISLEAGAHPKIVQERLGHASIQTTLDVYSHLSVDLQRAAAEELGRRLFGEAADSGKRDSS